MKLDLGKPEKSSFIYFLLHNTWFRALFFFWFKRIQVTGLKNVYIHKTTIIAPNHQNTAMDALAVLGVLGKSIVWLARADMFKTKAARMVLQSMKIMPIFRQRDGLKALANNEKVFEKCIDVLESGTSMALFPEATHWGFRRLRETKKAVPRIAFLAESKHNFELDVHVIPTGIYYENYENPRSNLLVNFGEPISVKQFQALYNENPQQAQQELKEAIDAGMKKQMLTIQHFDEEYEAYDLLRYICADEVTNRYGIPGMYVKKRFNIHKKVVELLDVAQKQNPEIHAEIMAKTTAYKLNLKKHGFRDWVVEQLKTGALRIFLHSIALLLTLPVFVVGYILHAYLFHGFAAIAKKAAKDKLFRSTITFALSFVILPLVYAIYSVIWLVVFNMPTWSLAPFIVGIFASAFWSYDYARLAKKTFKVFKFNVLLARKTKATCKLVEQRKEIIELFRKIS